MAKKKNRDRQEARTIDEIMDELRNSILDTPIVIVEGRDDVQVYREIALRHLSASQIAFDFAGIVKEGGQREGGGRNNLLTLFKRVKTESPKLKRKILFFADQDFEVFTGIPPKWEGFHFTNGYTMENDLFADGQAQRFLHADEQPVWQKMIDELCNWFAGQVYLSQRGRAAEMKIDLTMRNPDHRDLVAMADDCPDLDLLAQIKADFVRLTRGKHLFELLWHIHQTRLDGLQKKEISHFWQDCINQGLENNNSNTYRISQLLRASVVGGQP